MSISTLESPASRRALAQFHAEQDELSRAETGVREEIALAFGTTLRQRPAASIAVPTVAIHPMRETAVTVAAVAADILAEGGCQPELLAVLERSDCPLVQRLRVALGECWAKNVASDVAPYRVL